MLFSVLAGEAIHHLRSSLDHLVWALASRRNANPPGRIQFPICSSAEKFAKACKGGIIHGLSRKSHAAIERSQPYWHRYRTPDPENHPLFILNEMNNTDKHRLLVVVSCTTVFPKLLRFSGDILDYHEIDITPKNWGNRLVKAEKGHTELARIRFARPVAPDMEVSGKFAPQVALEQYGRGSLKALIPGLVELRDAVVKVIGLFESEF
jgi:hypothetical protein